MTTQLEQALNEAHVEDITLKPTLQLVGIELPVEPGNISFVATKPFLAKVYHLGEDFSLKDLTEEQIKSRVRVKYMRFNPFKVQQGKVVQRGSFHPTSNSTFKCPNCQREFVFDMAEERKSKARDRFYCGTCFKADKVKHELQHVGRLKPMVNASTVKTMMEHLNEVSDQSAEVIPDIYGVFASGTAPGAWTPKTELEKTASERLAEQGREMVPYRIIGKVKSANPNMVGMIGLGRPVNSGWVDEVHFSGKDTGCGFTRTIPARVRKRKSILV